jgi:hypothetical protein
MTAEDLERVLPRYPGDIYEQVITKAAVSRRPDGQSGIVTITSSCRR